MVVLGPGPAPAPMHCNYTNQLRCLRQAGLARMTLKTDYIEYRITRLLLRSDTFVHLFRLRFDTFNG